MSACPKENGEFLEKEVREFSVLLFESFTAFSVFSFLSKFSCYFFVYYSQ